MISLGGAWMSWSNDPTRFAIESLRSVFAIVISLATIATDLLARRYCPSFSSPVEVPPGAGFPYPGDRVPDPAGDRRRGRALPPVQPGLRQRPSVGGQPRTCVGYGQVRQQLSMARRSTPLVRSVASS